MRIVEKLKKRHMAIILVSVVVYSFALLHIAQAVTAGTAEPGSDQNPLVAQDYVDGKISELDTKINIGAVSGTVNTLAQTVAALNQQVIDLQKNQTQQEAPVMFVPLFIEAGKQLEAGEGTEIILRASAFGGKAVAVEGEKGDKLIDIISGSDFQEGVSLPVNSYLIASRSDGRGFKVVDTRSSTTQTADKAGVYVLIKGQYTLK